MTPSSHNSIALLIDADNAPAAKIDFIISELAGHGVVNIRRAYGNWKKPGLAGWEKVLHENSIQPMQSFDLVKGKNATDMALLIDAMDILYTKNVNTFCLVSSDCDFTPLIQRLRADGKEVYGFGGKNTPMPFIASCTRFIYLGEDEPQRKLAGKAALKSAKTADVVPAKEPEKPVRDTRELKGNTKLMNTLRDAVSESGDKDGWARLGPVGSRISNAGPFDHRTYGFRKLSDLFAAIDLFEVRTDASERNGNQAIIAVRIKPVAGKAEKADAV